jgi:hypothetical protein
MRERCKGWFALRGVADHICLAQGLQSPRNAMARPDLPPNSQAIQRFGHMRLHAHEEEMLVVCLNHIQHFLNSQGSGGIDGWHL